MRKYVKRFRNHDELEDYLLMKCDYGFFKKVYVEEDYKYSGWKVTMFYDDEKENENAKEN